VNVKAVEWSSTCREALQKGTAAWRPGVQAEPTQLQGSHEIIRGLV